MKINRDELRFWVGMADKIVPSTKLADDLQRSVVIEFSAEKAQCVVKMNSDVHGFIFDYLEATGETDMRFAVNATEFFHALNGKEEFVELVMDEEENQLKLQSLESDFVMSLYDVSNFRDPLLLISDTEVKTCGEIPKGKLVGSLKAALPFLSKEHVTPHLMGVLFQGNKMYASDLSHHARFRWDDFTLEENLNFIPNSMIEVLGSGGTDNTPVQLSYNSEWVIFEAGPLTALTRRWSLAGEYETTAIDDEFELTKDHKGSVKLNCESLKSALDRINFFVQERLAILRVSRKQITLQAFREDRTTAKVPVTGLTNLAKETVFLIDISHLQALLSIGQEQVDLKVGNPADTIYYADEKAEYQMVPAILAD